MATTALGVGSLTLLDWAKRLDPNGKVPTIVELLGQTNQILDDAVFKEGNLPTGERTTVRTGLPTVYWRLLNQYVSTSKSLTAQIDEGCGMLEAWSSTDKDLAELGGNLNALRLSEANAYIEAMNQEMAGTLFYGNSGTAAEEFTGLAPRYSAISGATNAQNVISAGGASTDNYSIWLVGWAADKVFCVFPKGSKAGLIHENLGLQTLTNSSGQKLRAYEDHWQWKCGLVVKDWRYVVRICNIDISNLIGVTSAADLAEFMIRATYRVPNTSGARFAWYMNRTCAEMLHILLRNDVQTGGQLSYDTVAGKRILKFADIPIRICDQLVTETTAIT